MKLKEARKMAKLIRRYKKPLAFQTYEAILLLDDRIIELEGEGIDETNM